MRGVVTTVIYTNSVNVCNKGTEFQLRTLDVDVVAFPETWLRLGR